MHLSGLDFWLTCLICFLHSIIHSLVCLWKSGPSSVHVIVVGVSKLIYVVQVILFGSAADQGWV